MPTKWQAKQFPQKLKPYLSVVFDGIDLDFFQPSSPDLFDKSISIEGEHDTILIDQDDILLTYATRGMEPMRGFPEFMKTLPTLLRKLSNLKVIIGGRDRSAYGPACPTHNGSWKDRMLDELPELLNHPRIIYTGLMNYGNYRLMLQRTNLHCYFTKPYVTSWSLFEAAACGAPILSNRSPATNGTLEIPANYLVDQIADVYQEKGLHLIESLLSRKANKERESNIDKDLSREKSKHNWEVLINNALQSQADTRNSYEPGVD